MAKWVFDQWDNVMEYPTLGIIAEPGDILDALMAPDGRWSQNADQAAAETVYRYAVGGDPNYVEPTDGHVLTYDATQNTYVPTAPETVGFPSLAAAVADLDNNPASDFRVQQDARLSATIARRGVLMSDHPRQGAETTDDAAFDRAIDAAIANGSNTVIFPTGTWLLSATHTISTLGFQIIGLGWDSTIQNANNTTVLEITGDEFRMSNIHIFATDVGRTNFPVRVTGPHRPIFDTVFFGGNTDSRAAGLFLNGGLVAWIKGCLFNHACVRVETYDVKIESSYIWAMTCEYGIGLLNGAGNLTVVNTDIVPPLLSTAYGVAGVYVDGPNLQVKLLGLYIDGNGVLETRQGIYLGDGVGQVIIQGCSSNNMASDVIVVDSAYNVLIDGYSGYANNRHGYAAREIVVKETGTQPVTNVRIQGAQCLQTAAGSGTRAPAIFVDTATVEGQQVAIEGFNINQPAGGGGYTNPEVVCDAATTSLSGRGTLSQYSARGSQAIAAGATSATINFSSPFPMAYRPKASDFVIALEGDRLPNWHFTYGSDNQINVFLESALGGGGTLHWKVDLRR